MQRRKDLWGDDAEDFQPERWIEAHRIKIIRDDPFKFLPFNAGPRVCLGQSFAYNEASFSKGVMTYSCCDESDVLTHSFGPVAAALRYL